MAAGVSVVCNLLEGKQPSAPTPRRWRHRVALFAAVGAFSALMVAQVAVGVAAGFAAPAVVEAPASC
jgi:hypothetical protein